MKNIFTIARKEWQSYFNNPTAYIILGAFLLLWEFLFFRNVFLIGEASLRTLFDTLPWIAIVVIPALTMGALAEERSEGTIEFLLSHPLRAFELVLGKFVGIWSVLLAALLFVFPLAASFASFGNLDWGQVVSQYIAAALLSALLASLGIFLSGLFASQISAFVVAAVAGFFLVISGMDIVTSRLPLSLAPFFDQLSITNHFSSMTRGAIDLRDLWYFLSFTAIFLTSAVLNVLREKYGNKKEVFRKFQAAFSLLVGIVILSNIVGSRIPGRFDLTTEKLYTLSPATRSIVETLPDDIVSMTLYASDKLPAQLQPVLRETQDILRDYASLSKGKIQFATKNPSSGSEVASEASSLGVQSVRFNVVSQEEFQVKEGYLGVVIAYGGKHEAIPFLQDTNGLEYQISGFLKQLTTDKKPKIGFISGHGERSLFQDYQSVSEEWRKIFDVRDIAAETPGGEEEAPDPKKPKNEPPKEKTLTIPDDIKTVIVAGPDTAYSASEKKTLEDFLNRGGNAFFLLSGVMVSPQMMTASANKDNLADFLKERTGIEVKQNLVYDLRSNEPVSFGGGQMQYVLPYPLWVRALRAETTSPIVARLESLTLPWPSSIEADEKAVGDKGFRVETLFTTSKAGGAKDSDFSIEPDQKWSEEKLGQKALAVALSPKEGEGAAKSRIVVVGNADFLADRFMRNDRVNLSFSLEALSWLAQESSLGSIVIKNTANRKFAFADQSEPNLVKFGNMGLVVLLTAGYGSLRLYRRSRKKRLAYESSEV